MKDLSIKILEHAAMGGPFFAKKNLTLWLRSVKTEYIEDALKEGIDELYLASYQSTYYYFKSKTKFDHFTAAHSLNDKKHFFKSRLQHLTQHHETSPEVLAILAMQIGAVNDAIEFWLSAALNYFQLSAWFHARQCLDNVKLILLDKPRTDQLKELESLYQLMITEFDHLDWLHKKNVEKLNKFTFPVSVSDQIKLYPNKAENHQLPHLEEVEKAYMLWAIDSVKGNKTKAAKLLGINRTTMIMRMKKLGILGE